MGVRSRTSHAAVLLLLLAAAAGFVAVTAQGSADDDLITSLPGLDKMPDFKMYSGYVTVNETHGRSLFYLFAESQNDPKNDPLLVWLQGGPGCSSLVGMMTENGPLRAVPASEHASSSMFSGDVNSAQYLMDALRNEHDSDAALNISIAINGWSWNRFANVLYIDSPAGVGFSYSNTSSDYNTDNNKTSLDTYNFLRLWSKRFEQFDTHDLWLAGESYGGDYVPQLAERIVDGSDDKLKKNLKGFAVGNPVFSCDTWKQTSNDVQIELFYWHGLIPFSSYTQWKKAGCAEHSTSDDCNKLFNSISKLVGPDTAFDPDNIYTDFSLGNATLGVGPSVPPGHSLWDYRNTWLNYKSVQEAMHVFNPKQNWTTCCAEPGQTGAACKLNYTNNWDDMLPLYRHFFKAAPNLRILIYSGDTDIATCPHAYAQLCLAELGRDLKQPWAPWALPDDAAKQIAGYVEVYDTYTYATVKGAGHEVPQFQPRAAFHLISSFIHGSFP